MKSVSENNPPMPVLKNPVWRRMAGLCAALLLLLAAAVLLMPWKMIAAGRLEAALTAQGLRDVHLTVSDIGLSGMTLKDVTIGAPASLVVPELKIDYAWRDLWSGRLRNLNIGGLTVEARQTGGRWAVTGLESGGGALGVALPMNEAQIAAIPLEQARLAQSRLLLTAEDWALDLPLELIWQKTPAPRLAYEGKNLSLTMGDLKGLVYAASVELAFDAGRGQWRGDWRIEDIVLRGSALEIPPLACKGSINIDMAQIAVHGVCGSADRLWQAEFTLDDRFNKSGQWQLKLVSMTMPWNGGALAARNVIVPMGRARRDIHIDLEVKRVVLDTLVEQMTGKRASAKGAVSGRLPVTIKPDGAVIVAAGRLQAEAPGVIAVAPDLIPGDHEQVVLVREVLKDFHYTRLRIGLDSGKDGKLAVMLNLAGNNPAAAGGRMVNLNVHLGGEVLKLIQQSLMTLSDPKQFLRHE